MINIIKYWVYAKYVVFLKGPIIRYIRNYIAPIKTTYFDTGEVRCIYDPWKAWVIKNYNKKGDETFICTKNGDWIIKGDAKIKYQYGMIIEMYGQTK